LKGIKKLGFFDWVLGGFVEELVTVRKVGGSLMVAVPKDVVLALGVRPKDKLRVEFKKPKIDLFGIYKGTGLTSFTEADRLDSRE
jgi:hypothetical protein